MPLVGKNRKRNHDGMDGTDGTDKADSLIVFSILYPLLFRSSMTPPEMAFLAGNYLPAQADSQLPIDGTVGGSGATLAIRLERARLSTTPIDILTMLDIYSLIAGWIQKTLAEPGKAPKPVPSLGFRRLPHYYDEKVFACAKAVFVSRVPGCRRCRQWVWLALGYH